jgi:hypothetical protein
VKTNIATYKYWGFRVLLTSDGWFSQHLVSTAPSCLVKERSEGGLMPVTDCRPTSAIDNSFPTSLMDYNQRITRGKIVFVSQEILPICPEVIGVNPCLWLGSPTVIQLYNLVTFNGFWTWQHDAVCRRSDGRDIQSCVSWLDGTIRHIVHTVGRMSYRMHKGCAEVSCLPAE